MRAIAIDPIERRIVAEDVNPTLRELERLCGAPMARLEARGQCQLLLTQNVDRLHQAAGSREVIDLHGRLDLVRCTACSTTIRRANFQDELAILNAAWIELDAVTLPDGDADLDHRDFDGFAVRRLADPATAS